MATRLAPRRMHKRHPKKGAKGKPVLEDIDEILRKKMHVHLKMIRKAVKKAKQFEIRKITRRLKDAQEKKSDDKSAGETSKIESQLNAARQADIDFLAKKAASSLKNIPEEIMEAATSDKELNAAEEIVHRHILGAKCVNEQLDIVATALQTVLTKTAKRLSGASKSDQQGIADDTIRKRNDNKIEEEEEEPDSFAQAALAKLLSNSQNTTTDPRKRKGSTKEDVPLKKSRKSNDNRGDNEGSDDDEDSLLGYDNDDNNDDSQSDSGVIEDDLSSMSDVSEEVEEQEDGNSKKKLDKTAKETQNGDTDKMNAKNKKGEHAAVNTKQKKEKKVKNRLGQRARRKLAEQMHGQQAKHIAQEKADAKKKQKETKNTGTTDDDVHPSWAAKRQQKAKIIISSNASPVAQKITFGKSSSSLVDKKDANKNMHPSWELKKKQHIEQLHAVPQGKKVVFDDDSD